MRRSQSISKFSLSGVCAGVLVTLAIDKGPLWIALAVGVIVLGYALIVYRAYVPAAEEEARKNAEWLAQIDRDYKRIRSVEDRLDELERLKRRDLVTPEEYTAKRQDILKDL